MPREIILRMHLTNHMVYDCADQGQETGIHLDYANRPASFSFAPAEQDQLANDTEETDEKESAPGDSED